MMTYPETVEVAAALGSAALFGRRPQWIRRQAASGPHPVQLMHVEESKGSSGF